MKKNQFPFYINLLLIGIIGFCVGSQITNIIYELIIIMCSSILFTLGEIQEYMNRKK